MTAKADNLKRLVWLYFWLLIFEGVLRKWIFPQYSAPLLIVRDPILLAIYALAIVQGRFPKGPYVVATIFLGLASVAASFTGKGTLWITLYGFRTNFLHLPMIFLIPAVFTRRDVEKVGRWMVLLAPAIALLVLAQFRGQPGSWLNVGAGGGEGGQLESALGKIRPPGPFSFVTGMVAYSSLLAAFLFDHYARGGKVYGRRIATVATGSMVLCLGLSGSRSSIVSVVVVLAGAAYLSWRRREVGRLMVGPLLTSSAAFGVLSLWSQFRVGLLVNQQRFQAGGIQQGLFVRFFNSFRDPLVTAWNTPILGEGLGLGTNAGAMLATGALGFLLAEGEWDRVILESGPILGVAYIILRLAIVWHLGGIAFRQVREGRSLPILLFCACFLNIVNGQFGPPTMLGFAVFGGGLCLASAGTEQAAQSPGIIAQAVPVDDNRVRGRSRYAELLHGQPPAKPTGVASS